MQNKNWPRNFTRHLKGDKIIEKKRVTLSEKQGVIFLNHMIVALFFQPSQYVT